MTDFDKIELTECVFVPADFCLQSGFTALAQLYRELDQALQRTTETLDLPCKAGCDACCHQSVFLTPLEFLAAWDWLLYMAGHKEHSPDHEQNTLVRTIDGVGRSSARPPTSGRE